MIRKHYNFILQAALLILSVQAMICCRSMKSAQMKADSSSHISAQTSEKWNREVIREYLPGRTDTVDHFVQIPKYIQGPSQPMIIRETIRDSGEREQAVSQEKTVAIQEKQVEKTQLSPWLFLAAGAGFMLILVILLGVVYFILKARILASITK